MYLFYIFILGDISLTLAHSYDSYAYLLNGQSTADEQLVTKRLYLRDEDAINPRSKNNIRKRQIVSSTNYNESDTTVKVHKHEDIEEGITKSNGSKLNLPILNTSLPSAATLPTTNSVTEQKTVVSKSSEHIDDGGLPLPVTNDTLKQHNITSKSEDFHIYYNSTFFNDPETFSHYWVEMNNRSDAIIHQTLSHSHRRAAIASLPFKFQFYGHDIENVTIATGGFIYAGDYMHSWLAATQYIAPLMANFDTSLSNDSNIKIVSNSTAFTVMWENVPLQEHPKAGNFTFQVTLNKNGDIIFVYKNIPDIINEITEDLHPVKVGLSDAYILERTIFFVRRKTIFEYHRVHFEKTDLRNGTVIYLVPLPTCHKKTTCESCLSKETHFECQWCDNRCSTGVDRKRQDWVEKECEKRKLNDTKYCSLMKDSPHAKAHRASKTNDANEKGGSSKLFFITILIIVTGVTFFVWISYAYRNPHSASGQVLIKYRPSQWNSWRKGEARYTAATLHM